MPKHGVSPGAVLVVNTEPDIETESISSPSGDTDFRAAVIEPMPYSDGQAALWDELVARARNGHFMVTRRFLDYHGKRFRDGSLMFLNAGRVVAVLPLHEDGGEWISHRGIPFGGLIAAPELSYQQTEVIFRQIGLRMRTGGITGLRYTPTPHVYQAHPFEDDLFILHSLGARMEVLKLAARARLPELSLMQKRTRRYLRQTVPQIVVEHEVSLEEFWNGLTSYLDRRHLSAPVHTLAEMADLLGRFPELIKLFGIRNPQGRLGAGLLVFLTGQVIRMQYAFGADDAEVPRQSMLALDQAAIEKFGAGRSWVDFGTSMSPVEGTLDRELHIHKERSGARGMRVETWVWGGLKD